MTNEQWFYEEAGQQQGPVSFEQIQRLVTSGQIKKETLIWNQGMPTWTPAGQVAEVSRSFSAPGTATANPYAAPAPGERFETTTGGDYPIPVVKKCSFPLFLVTYILGFIFLFATFIPLIPPLIEAVAEMEELAERSYQSPEAKREAQEEMAHRVEEKLEQSFTPEKVMLIVSLLLCGLVFATIALVINCLHIYRAWSILQPGGARTTPGKAVGFLFIPLFNIYWVFIAYHGWSQDWNRIQGAHPNLSSFPRVPEALFLMGCIAVPASLIPGVGYLAILASWIILPIMLAQMCRVVNQMAESRHS